MVVRAYLLENYFQIYEGLIFIKEKRGEMVDIQIELK
jgi:hypothetical protein